MEEEKTTNPPSGTWDRLPTEETPKLPKIDFQVNIPVEVTFLNEEPTELQGDNGAYYIFQVREKDIEKVIMTSAWTLLRGLKIHSPLVNKTLVITKKLVNGKQSFIVETKN